MQTIFPKNCINLSKSFYDKYRYKSVHLKLPAEIFDITPKNFRQCPDIKNFFCALLQ